MYHYYNTSDGGGNRIDNYADLASLNQYLNLQGSDSIVTMPDPWSPLPMDMENWMNDPWKLRVFEDEILGECGSGAQNCSHTLDGLLTTGMRRRRKRSASTGKWGFLVYEKVKIP